MRLAGVGALIFATGESLGVGGTKVRMKEKEARVFLNIGDEYIYKIDS